MNIFILDKIPATAAKMHCDIHVNKMIVESAQMLSTAHRVIDGVETRRRSKSGLTMPKYWELPDEREDLLYKPCHVNHPCSIWARESKANYIWLFELFENLCWEFTDRFEKIHASERLLALHLGRLPNNIPDLPLTPFARAFGPEYDSLKEEEDDVTAYRKYYISKQDKFNMTWRNDSRPNWFEDKAQCQTITTAA